MRKPRISGLGILATEEASEAMVRREAVARLSLCNEQRTGTIELFRPPRDHKVLLF